MPILPFRDRIKTLSPPWLQDGTGERFMYCPGTGIDADLEALTQSTLAHMPTRGTADALKTIGADRGPIVQGPNEPDASFRVRLQKAPALWAKWGSPFAILEQLAAFFLPAFPTLYLVTDSGHWYTLVPGPTGNREGVLTPAQRPPAHASNWNWDPSTSRRVEDAALASSAFALTSASAPFAASDVGKAVQVAGAVAPPYAGADPRTLVTTISAYVSPTQVTLAAAATNTVTIARAAWGAWWRFWIVVDVSAIYTRPVWGAPLKWGQPGLVWGGSFASGTAKSLRSIIKPWMPEHSYCQNIILDFAGHFQPTGSGAGYPAGDWQFWVNRFQPAAYLDGVGPDDA